MFNWTKIKCELFHGKYHKYTLRTGGTTDDAYDLSSWVDCRCEKCGRVWEK